MTIYEINRLPTVDELSKQNKDEAAIIIITNSIIEYMDVVGEFNYDDKDAMIKVVKEEVVKFDFFANSKFEDK